MRHLTYIAMCRTSFFYPQNESSKHVKSYKRKKKNLRHRFIVFTFHITHEISK